MHDMTSEAANPFVDAQQKYDEKAASFHRAAEQLQADEALRKLEIEKIRLEIATRPDFYCVAIYKNRDIDDMLVYQEFCIDSFNDIETKLRALISL